MEEFVSNLKINVQMYVSWDYIYFFKAMDSIEGRLCLKKDLTSWFCKSSIFYLALFSNFQSVLSGSDAGQKTRKCKQKQ